MKKNKYQPCSEPNYESHDHEHDHQVPPDNLRYSDRRIYGDYASKEPPAFVPHPYEHAVFDPARKTIGRRCHAMEMVRVRDVAEETSGR